MHSKLEANNSSSMALHTSAHEESEIVCCFLSAGVSSSSLPAKLLTPAGLASRSLMTKSGASFQNDVHRLGVRHPRGLDELRRRIGVHLQHYPQRRTRNLNERVASPNGVHCCPSDLQYGNLRNSIVAQDGVRFADEKLATFYAHHLRIGNYGTLAVKLFPLKGWPDVLVAIIDALSRSPRGQR